METIEDIYKQIDKKIEKLEPKVKELETKTKNYTYWAWAFVIIGFVVASIGLYAYFNQNEQNQFTLNELGDYFAGTVASAWALAGLFFIYVAFLGQKQQLINQQIELSYNQAEVKATRYELRGQKEQLIEQNKTAKLQRFENTFFSLLKNHSSMVNDIDLRSGGNITEQGKDCIKTFYKRFRNKCQGYVNTNQLLIEELPIDQAIEFYMEMYHSNQADLGHYFRNLYHILKLLKNENVISDKKKYSNLLRAQLSSYELAILFYNCLGDYGYEKFYPLIEQFDFLKNLDRDLLISPDHLNEYETLKN